MSSPPHLENFCRFAGQKMAAKCTSAGQFTGQRTIGELLGEVASLGVMLPNVHQAATASKE